MRNPAQGYPPSASGLPENFTWLSNPIDWRPIDRFVLLGALLILAPMLFGLALLAAMFFAPSYLSPMAARLLLAMYALHVLVLIAFLAAALRRRRHCDDWPVFETIIIVSFVINVLASSFATGTYLTVGMLMVFLGISIASALANVAKVQVAYGYVCITILIFVMIDFSGMMQSAPLFVKIPLKPDGLLYCTQN